MYNKSYSMLINQFRLQKNKLFLSPEICSVIIVISIFLFASSQQQLINSDATSTIPATKIKFSLYNNSDLGIKFLYPTGWEPIVNKMTDSSTVIEILFPNSTTNSNNNTINSGHWHGPSTSFITLSILNASSFSNSTTPATLDSLTKQNLNLANATLPNFELIEANMTTFANNPAYRIVYTFIDPSIGFPVIPQFQSMNVWTVKGDKVYTLSYLQPTQEYATYLSVAQQIVNSFEITK
jgi:PsbP-like protein